MKYDLDNDSPVPLYYQIQKSIMDALESNEWKTGEIMPSERELSNNFKVSRITIRKALERLIYEGYINKKRGRGAVILGPKVQERLFDRLTGTFQDLNEKGFDIKNKILSYNQRIPKIDEQENLKINKKEAVIFFKRLRFIDGVAYHYSETSIPRKICPNLDSKLLVNDSLINVLTKDYALNIYKVKRVLFASIAGIKESKLLNIQVGSPIFSFYNTAYLKDSTAVEYSLNKIRGDISKFEINITRDKVENVAYKF